MSQFKSSPMPVKSTRVKNNNQGYMLLPNNLRASAGGLSKLDHTETVSANPKKTGNNYGPNGCYRDPLAWLCYKQDGKCVCPMRGD